MVDSVTGAPDPVVTGNTVTFSATLSGGAPATYAWTATNGTISGADDQPTVDVIAGTAGTPCEATLTVTNAGGSDNGTGQVTVNAAVRKVRRKKIEPDTELGDSVTAE